MSKLEPALEHALIVWQVRRGDGSTATPEQAELIDAERVAVIVTHEGDLGPLRAAGLDTGFDQDGVVSGQIAFAELERLAEVPEVVRIDMEPPVRPLLDDTLVEIEVPWKVPPTSAWPGKGAGAIVAVIDTGIDIFHDSFRKSDGTTRILELWDQAAIDRRQQSACRLPAGRSGLQPAPDQRRDHGRAAVPQHRQQRSRYTRRRNRRR